jgi:hypothetical protein
MILIADFGGAHARAALAWQETGGIVLERLQAQVLPVGDRYSRCRHQPAQSLPARHGYVRLGELKDGTPRQIVVP